MADEKPISVKISPSLYRKVVDEATEKKRTIRLHLDDILQRYFKRKEA